MQDSSALPASDLGALPDEMAADTTTLVALPARAMLNLRGDPSSRAFVRAVKKVLALDLPSVNTRTFDANHELVWLGPDEWWVTAPFENGAATAESLAAALAKVHHACSDVGDGFQRLRVDGPHARDMLAKGCPFDLHGSAFSSPSVAGTVVAKAQATLIAGDGQSIELVVRRSFADYLWQWLKVAGEEYNCVVGAAGE